MNTEIKKCPVKNCHGNVVLSEDYDEYGVKCYIISCAECNTKLQMRDRQELIDKWNIIKRDNV